MKLVKLTSVPYVPGQYFVQWHGKTDSQFEVIQVVMTPARTMGGLEFSPYLSAHNGKSINRFKCDWYEIVGDPIKSEYK